MNAFTEPLTSGAGATVTPQTAFRGETPGDLIGPYLSQFLWLDILWFPKIRSGRIRAVRQNQRIIAFDACDRPLACSVCRQSVQVAAPA